jgi:hypothetical protein
MAQAPPLPRGSMTPWRREWGRRARAWMRYQMRRADTTYTRTRWALEPCAGPYSPMPRFRGWGLESAGRYSLVPPSKRPGMGRWE